MKMLWLFAILGTIIGSAISQSDLSRICPNAELISPCTCSKECDKCEAITVCSNIVNLDQLKSVFRTSKDYTFWNFHIVNSTFLYIPSEAFSEKRVRKLYLSKNSMSSLFEKPPPKTNDLKKIELSDLTLRRPINWEWFTSFSNLDELTIMKYEVKKIDDSFMNNFPRHLTELRFTNTDTKKLSDDAFSKLSELVALEIKNTKIKLIKRSMFPTPSTLFALDLSGNQISSLPDDIFSDMPELQAIDLSHTQVKTVSETVFGEIMPRLGVLSMEGNAMECTCAMKWITQLSELPMYLDMVCATPEALAEKAVKDLKPSHFQHCS